MKRDRRSTQPLFSFKGSDGYRALRIMVSCAMFSAVFLAGIASASAGAVHKKVPDVIDPGAKYLFYMHGLAIELGGERADAYNYTGILKELARRDFVVIGEKRGRVKNVAYAQQVVDQVKVLLAAGVPAGNITVAGHSKGAMITMHVMAMVRDPDIAYVNFAGCGRKNSGFEGYLQFAEKKASKARGRLLSAYDKRDKIAGSCKPALDRMTNAYVKEVVLEIGGGHEAFYRPNDKWINVLVDWANRQE